MCACYQSKAESTFLANPTVFQKEDIALILHSRKDMRGKPPIFPDVSRGVVVLPSLLEASVYTAPYLS